ncbi:MAG: thioesterase family protein [Ectothiorhodospiraceae bacterium]|nr:thioesterase family protein [Ectothiorhodospiraceae bacterium]
MAPDTRGSLDQPESCNEMTMSDALFQKDGQYHVPTDQSRGPWSPDHLHGGPVVGLMAHAAERASAQSQLRLARLTVDLLRAVPKQPLRVEANVVRPGRRLQVLEVRLLADDTEVTRATALFLERNAIDVPAHGLFPETALAPPDATSAPDLATAAGWDARYSPVGFHTTAQAVVLDGVRGQGHGRVWMRLPLPLVEGEDTSASVMAATLCDFGNGVGQLNLGPDLGSINADVSLYLHRPPAGKWLGLDAASHMQPNGMGLVETTLFDMHGPVGKVLQATIAMSTRGK